MDSGQFGRGAPQTCCGVAEEFIVDPRGTHHQGRDAPQAQLACLVPPPGVGLPFRGHGVEWHAVGEVATNLFLTRPQ